MVIRILQKLGSESRAVEGGSLSVIQFASSLFFLKRRILQIDMKGLDPINGIIYYVSFNYGSVFKNTWIVFGLWISLTKVSSTNRVITQNCRAVVRFINLVVLRVINCLFITIVPYFKVPNKRGIQIVLRFNKCVGLKVS